MSSIKLKNSTKLKKLFRTYAQIKVVYFFGSRVSGQNGPMSDYDFAFYVNERNRKKIFKIKCELIGKISKILQTNAVDVVMLNSAESPELKYNIIKDGYIIYERHNSRIDIEPKILNEYFDFYTIAKAHDLTTA